MHVMVDDFSMGIGLGLMSVFNHTLKLIIVDLGWGFLQNISLLV